MDKKGISSFALAGKSVYWTIAIIVLTVVVLAYVGIMTGYVAKVRATPELLRAEVTSARFVNSADCFTYSANGRTYPGVIDLRLFTQERMDKCYNTKDTGGVDDFNYLLTLGDKQLRSNDNFRKRDFTIIKPVLVRSVDGLKYDQLRIDVQVKI